MHQERPANTWIMEYSFTDGDGDHGQWKKGAVLLVWHNVDCGTPVSYGREVAAAVAGEYVVEGEVASWR